VAKDPHGKTYYWIGGGAATWESPEGSDYWAVEEGYVSITPIHLDMTHHRILDRLKRWEATPLGARS
jgi:5'-nucleotidase